MSATVIRNGRIVTAVDDYKADILMEDGRVRMIGTDLPVGEGVAEHDASGLLVLPGGVDVHTHLDWDFGPARTADTFYTGSQAGAFGGTTTIVDFAAQVKGSSPLAGLADWHERASVAAVDVGAHMILTEVNDQILVDMKSLIHDEGVTTFKLFTAYPDVLMIDDGSTSRPCAWSAATAEWCRSMPRTAMSSTCWCRRRWRPATPARSGI